MTKNSSKKTVDTLVQDIYKTLENCKEIREEDISNLGVILAETISSRLLQPTKKRTHLSLSSIGKPLRRLWYDLKEPEAGEEEPSYYRLKFLYGDIIEVLLLWLAKVSGHTVTDQQKEVNHYDVIGHIDSIIDGEVIDVKSASQRSYAKFLTGNLVHDDPFGYLAQIASYDKEVGQGHPGFLVANKVTGEICLYRPDVDFDCPDTKVVIENCREALSKDTPPEKRCYDPEPAGTSGNMQLSKGCSLCPYKLKCWDNLRAFKYASGVQYLTKVVKEPKVEEIKID